VASKIFKQWISIDNIWAFLDLEPVLVVYSLALGSWVLYKIFLRKVSEDRHRLFDELFKNLTGHVFIFTGLYLCFNLIAKWADIGNIFSRILPYVGLISILSLSNVFIKTSRIIAFEYLFIGHMKQGVPLLLVNIFTLILVFVLAAVFASATCRI
jgi:hypothetical protein